MLTASTERFIGRRGESKAESQDRDINTGGDLSGVGGGVVQPSPGVPLRHFFDVELEQKKKKNGGKKKLTYREVPNGSPEIGPL